MNPGQEFRACADLANRGDSSVTEPPVEHTGDNALDPTFRCRALKRRQAVETYEFGQKQLEDCDRQPRAYLSQLPTRQIPGADAEAAPPPAAKEARDTDGKRKRKEHKGKRSSTNAPKSFDPRSELTRVCGVDVTTVDGLDVMAVQTVIAEIGPDVGLYFPTESHFTSWLRACPKPDISGGKIIRQAREPAANRIMSVLRMAASSLLRSDSELGARYRHLRTRLGAPKAIKAMARHLACIIYRPLTKGHAWVDAGAQQFQRKRKERELISLKARAAAMGLKLLPLAGNRYPALPGARK